MTATTHAACQKVIQHDFAIIQAFAETDVYRVVSRRPGRCFIRRRQTRFAGSHSHTMSLKFTAPAFKIGLRPEIVPMTTTKCIVTLYSHQSARRYFNSLFLRSALDPASTRGRWRRTSNLSLMSNSPSRFYTSWPRASIVLHLRGSTTV
jgi:hypothetical protein